MAPLFTSIIFLLSTASLITASFDFGTKRLPNGGALFSLNSRQLIPRQGLVDCGGDPDCTPQTWGCQCGFVDDSWLNAPGDPSVPNSDPPVVSSAAPSAPAPSTTPAPAPSATGKVNPADATCTKNGGGCDCTDGSHPDQDEDGRCCIWDYDGIHLSHHPFPHPRRQIVSRTSCTFSLPLYRSPKILLFQDKVQYNKQC